MKKSYGYIKVALESVDPLKRNLHVADVWLVLAQSETGLSTDYVDSVLVCM